MAENIAAKKDWQMQSRILSHPVLWQNWKMFCFGGCQLSSAGFNAQKNIVRGGSVSNFQKDIFSTKDEEEHWNIFKLYPEIFPHKGGGENLSKFVAQFSGNLFI